MNVIEWLSTTAALATAVAAFLSGMMVLVGGARPLFAQWKKEHQSVNKLRSRRWAVVLGVLLIFASVSIFTSRYVIAQSDPLNAGLTSQAWEAFNKGRWAAAIAKADDLINEFQGQAERQQAQLEKEHLPLPATGTVSEPDKKTILRRGLLNDVATCFYIKGRAAETLGQKAVAKQAYQNAARLTYGRCWDPKGWFWSPAEVALDRLNQLK